MASKFRSKKEIIYDSLRDDIVGGHYDAGSRLVIDELAKQMGVSQIPIREAIQQLEADGFVTIEPYVGARISEIDATFIFEVFALLESMEIISSTLACSIISDAELEKLSQMISEMDKDIANPDVWSQKNKAFHLFICQCANTQLVMKMMVKTFAHWDRLRNHYLQGITYNRIAEAQEQHHLLLDAFQERDAEKVEHIIRDHNQSALASYSQHLEEQGHLVLTESKN